MAGRRLPEAAGRRRRTTMTQHLRKAATGGDRPGCQQSPSPGAGWCDGLLQTVSGAAARTSARMERTIRSS